MDQSRCLSCSTSLYLYSYTSRLDEDGVQKNSLFEPLWAKLNYRESVEGGDTLRIGTAIWKVSRTV
jgi:hypothetical protein